MSITKWQYSEALKTVSKYRKQVVENYESAKKDMESLEQIFDHDENTELRHVKNLSVRACNYAIWAYKDSLKLSWKASMPPVKVKHIAEMTENDLINQRNMGKKSIEEIKEVLAHCGLTLKLS